MADNNSDLNLKNARWFAKELGNFSPQEQGTLLRTEDFGEFEKILFDKGILNSIGLWQGRIDWRSQVSQGVPIPIAPPQTPRTKGKTGSPGDGLSAGLGLGVVVASRGQKYEDFKKDSIRYSENAAKRWEEEEKKNEKKPPKAPDPTRPKTKEEAYDKGRLKYHDILARGNQKQAREWATKHNDAELHSALERKRVEDERIALEKASKQGRLSKILRQSAPASPEPAAQTPLSPNTLGGGKPSELQGVQTPTTAPKASNFKGRARSLRSRFSPKAKRLINDALSYLQRLFKKSFIGSLIGAAGSLLSAAIAGIIAIATAAIGTISYIVGLITAKIVAITTFIVTLPILPIIAIIAVVIIVIVFFFPQGPTESPYPGITYSIGGPENVENGQNITYQIIFVYDPSVAGYGLDQITLVSSIPSQTTFVSATGIYDSTSEPGKVKWKLSANESSSGSNGKVGFYFRLTIDPEDDITVANTIYLEIQ